MHVKPRQLIVATLAVLLIGTGFVGTAAAHDHALDYDPYVPAIDGPYVGLHIDYVGTWKLMNFGAAYAWADLILDAFPRLDACRSRVSVAYEIQKHALAFQHTAGLTCNPRAF